MKIKRIKIENFRLLKDFEITLENEISLVVGKNNTGKTSLITAIDIFLNNGKFTYNDLSLDLRSKIDEAFGGDTPKSEADYNPIQVKLLLEIEYSENDDLSGISDMIIDLETSNNILLLEFLYELTYENYKKVFEDYKPTKESKISRKDFFSKYFNSYFKKTRRSLSNQNLEPKELTSNNIERILNVKIIGAKRDVDNNDKSKPLTRFSQEYAKRFMSEDNLNVFNELENTISETDERLNDVYGKLFQELLKDINQMSSSVIQNIEVLSELNKDNLLKDNLSFKYKTENSYLPEDYNGLGYLNLLAIMFNLYMLLSEFQRDMKSVNLLIVEEPEAHAHPQMQYVFMQNIKQKINKISNGLGNVQTLITTHSAHIVSQSNFTDIKYFLKPKNGNSIKSKNLSDLKSLYEKSKDTGRSDFEFLQKYIKLETSELFFTDKVILIEGESERILLKAFMKKFDENKLRESHNEGTEYLPLHSQNISILEVGGTYAMAFNILIDFLEIKELIITDIDSCKEVEDENGKKTITVEEVKMATDTTNPIIKKILNDKTFQQIISLEHKNKKFQYKSENVTIGGKKTTIEKFINDDENGNILLCYQTKENGYHARSLEDAFISQNYEYIFKNKDKFNGLKCIDSFVEDPKSDFFEITKKCLDKKTTFAIDIIYNYKEPYTELNIPAYIEEGLEWLAK